MSMRHTLTALLLFAATAGYSQDTLQLSQVLQQGLEGNYGVVVGKLNQEVLNSNESYTWTNYAPEVTATGGINSSTQNVALTFASGDVQNRNGASTLSTNASAALTYRLFEGMGKGYRVETTQLTAQQGQANLELLMENTLADLMDAYYALVVAQNQLSVLEANLELSEERVELAKAQYEVGKASKLEYLQEQVDYNADRSQILSQQEAVSAAKIQLNVLMGLDPTTPAVAALDIPLDTSLAYTDLQGALEDNPMLLAQQKALELSAVAEQQAKTGFYPTLDANVNYGYNYSDAEAGFVLQNRSLGLNLGLTARWSLSGTLDAKRQRDAALIQTEAVKANTASIRLSLDAELARVFAEYRNRIAILALEQENVSVARENADIALERYRVGKSNALQLREAQRNQVEAESRLLNARYSIKVAETELLRLTGQLMSAE